jgi:hypothetical protein
MDFTISGTGSTIEHGTLLVASPEALCIQVSWSPVVSFTMLFER